MIPDGTQSRPLVVANHGHPEALAVEQAGAEDAVVTRCHGAAFLDPTQRPFCFFLYSRYGIDGVEEFMFFLRIFNIGIDQQRIGFGMDVFHHDLETIKASCFGQLHFAHKIHSQVLVYDTIACCEKGKYM